MLIRYGFNVNIRNRLGFTALMELARKNPSNATEARDVVRQIKLLLYFRADKTLAVLVRGKTRIARDLAVDPEIKQPLNLKQREVKFIFR